MPQTTIKIGSGDSTRERILKAAMLRFSAHSYEETGLRDVAADVGVDPAYVHRCFGSKEKLFLEAVRAAARPERLFSGDADELASTLASELFAERGENEIRSLDIVIRSFSSPAASRVLRDSLMEDFVGPLLRKRGQVSEKRAALVAAFLIGAGILRDVVRADPLLGQDEGELQEIIVQTIEELMNGDAVQEGDARCAPAPDHRGR
ncbi:AcrR family transcriptional regulator [Pseudochelatococcus lubricantis]|uniref:AcrR family transcriptional regulator n=1 Tax=Pseudochelatococcus lubricantis TaxID=1538102 RepID=A0ABX0V8D9_9HYPH|nr:TetR/AcrR family transcriptional regulator [Pseudochelatococcus lubricantis]NIJ60324.1 AcrR family transcriptional regulator [Pseudochelatococcus lubricantis]